MDNFKRIICGILCAAMLISAVACAESTPTKTDDTTVAEETSADTEAEEELDSLDSRQNVSDNLPATDWQGREYRSMTTASYLWDIWQESTTGDIVEDAIYARNQAMQDKYNFVIVEPVSIDDYNQISKRVINAVNAGDDEFDVVYQHMIQAGSDAIKDVYLNWYDLNYIDFTRPWYSQFAVEGLTVNGRMFTCFSDMQLAGIDRTYCIIYDKVYAENNKITNLAELASTGAWTIDKLIEISKQVYVDKNGDGNYDYDDFYGFSSPVQNNTSPFFYCFDIPRLAIDDEGTVSLAVNCEKMENTVLILRELFSDGVTWYGDNAADTQFLAGNALMYSAIVGDTLAVLRDYENDYGIIPYPKYDEAQENYYTIMGGGVTTLCIPKTVEDTDFVGFAVEAMSCETWKNVIPDYYDLALKVKGTRDEESVAILDMLLEGRAVDIFLAYDGWVGFCYKVNQLVGNKKNKEWSSFYSANEKVVLKHYQKVVDYFMGVEE